MIVCADSPSRASSVIAGVASSMDSRQHTLHNMTHTNASQSNSSVVLLVSMNAHTQLSIRDDQTVSVLGLIDVLIHI